MLHPVHYKLLSAAASISGLCLLHFAARPDRGEESEFRNLRVTGFVVAGILMALPLALWRWTPVDGAGMEPRISPLEPLLLAGYLIVVFFWFIWKVNSYNFRDPLAFKNPWEENWGAMYSPELKKRILGYVFEAQEKAGRIGGVVVDIGSGAAPASRLLKVAPGRKFIYLDIASANAIAGHEQNIRFDVRKINRPRSPAYRKAVARAAGFLGVDLRAEASPAHADLMVFSDILNYVDFREVISGFAKFLKPGGRIVIINLPSRGIISLFSEKGLKNNDDLTRYLEEQHYRIELKEFPCRPRGETDESEEMIVLVAEKIGPPAD
jgi:SAM-dependent methyltransferase